MNHFDLSIVIPTLNEAGALPTLLAGIAAQTGLAIQTIVADGGSMDETVMLASDWGAQTIISEPGRARQMNAGATLADAPLLLFLHADSQLPHAELLADALAAHAIRGDNRAAGHFALEFEHDGSNNGLLYRYMAAKSALNRRYTTNGDQGLLMTAERFAETGGFDERSHFLEDQRMVARLRVDGALFTLPGQLITSARRFETEGASARYHLMAIIMAMYVCDIKAFFQRAPGVYRQQAQLQTLLLTPYFRLLRQLMRDLGWRRSLRHWLAVGDFVLQESWQPFFLLDVLRSKAPDSSQRKGWLDWHDRRIAPWLHNRPLAALMALLVFAFSMGPLAAYYRWRERHLLKTQPRTAP